MRTKKVTGGRALFAMLIDAAGIFTAMTMMEALTIGRYGALLGLGYAMYLLLDIQWTILGRKK